MTAQVVERVLAVSEGDGVQVSHILNANDVSAYLLKILRFIHDHNFIVVLFIYLFVVYLRILQVSVNKQTTTPMNSQWLTLEALIGTLLLMKLTKSLGFALFSFTYVFLNYIIVIIGN